MCILISNYLKEYENAYKRELSQNWLEKIQKNKFLIDDIRIIKINSLKENLEITSFKIGFLGEYVGNVGRIIRFKDESYFISTSDLILKKDWDKIKQDETILFKIASFFKQINSKTNMLYISNVFEINSIEISYIDSLIENLKRGYNFYSESNNELLEKINNSKRIILKKLKNLYFASLLKVKYKWGITDITNLYVLEYFDPYLIEEILDISKAIATVKAIS